MPSLNTAELRDHVRGPTRNMGPLWLRLGYSGPGHRQRGRILRQVFRASCAFKINCPSPGAAEGELSLDTKGGIRLKSGGGEGDNIGPASGH